MRIKSLVTALALGSMLTSSVYAARSTSLEDKWWNDYKASGQKIVAYVDSIAESNPEAAHWFLRTGGKSGFSKRRATEEEKSIMSASFQKVHAALGGDKILESLQDTVSEGQKQIKALFREVGKLKDKTRKIDTDLKELREVHSRCDGVISALREEQRDLKERHDSLERDHNELRETHAQCDMRIRNLEVSEQRNSALGIERLDEIEKLGARIEQMERTHLENLEKRIRQINLEHNNELESRISQTRNEMRPLLREWRKEDNDRHDKMFQILRDQVAQEKKDREKAEAILRKEFREERAAAEERAREERIAAEERAEKRAKEAIAVLKAEMKIEKNEEKLQEARVWNEKLDKKKTKFQQQLDTLRTTSQNNDVRHLAEKQELETKITNLEAKRQKKKLKIQAFRDEIEGLKQTIYVLQNDDWTLDEANNTLVKRIPNPLPAVHHQNEEQNDEQRANASAERERNLFNQPIVRSEMLNSDTRQVSPLNDGSLAVSEYLEESSEQHVSNALNLRQ